MKKYILLFSTTILWLNVFGQAPAKYWVQFKDKAQSSYSVSRPEEFLSPQAIALRQLHNIAIDETDLPVNESYIKQVLALDDSMRLLTRSKWLNGITVYSNRGDILIRIRRLPCVAFAEKTITLGTPETDLDTVFQYGSSGPVRHTFASDVKRKKDFAYGKSEMQLRMTNIHWLHRMGYRGENVRLMVLDGGFSRADKLSYFQTLRDDNRLLGTYNLVQCGKSPFQTGTHGTTVLSCIAAYTPKEVVGSAPMVQVFLCQTEDGRTEHKIEEDNWVAGLELADSLGCQVLNSSLGYTQFDDSTQIRVYEHLTGKVSRASRAATMASAKGMIICNSAGNEGAKEWRHIGCPADAEGILTVGAVTNKRNRAFFSSYGPTADGRIKPDVCALGQMAAVAGFDGKPSVASGTSFSSPLMAGMTACLRQAYPKKSNVEIMDAIRQSASQSAQPDSLLGYGIPDFLRAYNILKQPANSTNDIAFDSFVANNDTLYITISDNVISDVVSRCVVTIPDNPKAKIGHLKNGSHPNGDGSVCYAYKIVLPKFKKKHSYKLTEIEINHFGETKRFVVGQE